MFHNCKTIWKLLYCKQIKQNNLLKETRDISFEEIIFAISNDKLLEVIENSNKEKYPNQKIYVQAAKESMAKNKRINIRLTSKDYYDIQVKAV